MNYENLEDFKDVISVRAYFDGDWRDKKFVIELSQATLK